ncbi:hypothetical protein ZYGR_0A01150 [Zygosaccharomyces rouxii]|uniref:Peroxisomal membrane protein PEX14 n=2 Tax=Zygosaccharomyces rouxii TaxID=4956 RepID=C5DPD9_ZYGRC|nr:uncharacterized protein ZYRO0A02574g [Zygosaccharomyces rouxii]KAH9198929.1 peroxisomal membrane anchor protein conserved region-domain-containing protein [Zygosaccharomyces rouxii]GAV46523.1 hypothetical protein ZYGR_0A01150 [Zygosaccharomyces rouxii]CAR25550.1 ZYRO0A02574p [Zygosaccharomyces rouxii]
MSTGVQDDRKPLFDSAVSFLSDPSVKDAPLTKKIEFLQSKGLTQQEVELALKKSQQDHEMLSQNVNNSSTATVAREPDRGSLMYEAVPPPLPRRDWKDYFIMATATAGLFYGVYEVTKRYVIPNILPEAQSKLEQDKKEIQDQFERVDKLLVTLENEQSEFKKQEEQKLVELDKTVVDLQTCLEQTSYTRDKIEDEFKIMKLEMANLQSKLDTFVMAKRGDQQLENISSELESLKNLIKTREMHPGNSTSSTNDAVNHKSPLNKNPVPGVEAIPSATEILSKMNFGNNNNNNKDQEQASVPAWKKAREESLNHSNSNPNSNSIPEWQKSAMNNTTNPELHDSTSNNSESTAQE